jgi:hypothetical protein
MSKIKIGDLVSAVICGSIASYAIYLTLTAFVTDQAAGGGPYANSAFYPRLLAGVIIFLSIILALSSFIKKKGDSAPARAESVDSIPLEENGQALDQDKISVTMIVAIVALQLIYTMILDTFGYLWLTPFYMALMFWMLKVRNWLLIAVLSLASTFALYYFFSLLLDVILP